MRKLFLFGLITISSTLIFGQISQGGSPSSFSLLGIKDVPTYNIEKPNMEQVSLEDDIDAKQETSIDMDVQFSQISMCYRTVFKNLFLMGILYLD